MDEVENNLTHKAQSFNLCKYLRQGLKQLFELFGGVKRSEKASAESPARSGRPKTSPPPLLH